MPSYILTVLDTCSIQEYVFGTNNLRQIIGASFLVERLLKVWVAELLPEPNNLRKGQNWEPLYSDLHIERDSLAAEVVYAGGGNAVIIFDTLDRARDFAMKLTDRVARETPGLKLTLAHSVSAQRFAVNSPALSDSREFDWERESIAEIYDSVMAGLFIKKQNLPASSPLLGLGVTASCAYTGNPAVTQESEVLPQFRDEWLQSDRLLSREIETKLKVNGEAGIRLREYLGDIRGYKLVSDFNEIGARGERSTMAVVHIDGNGMGRRFQDFGNQNRRDNRGWIQAMRNLSLSVQNVIQGATKETVCLLLNSIDVDSRIGGKVVIEKQIIPFRPVISGGDDVTYVCNGRLGLALTAKFLEALESRVLCDGQMLHARAGIAVVKTHYPFSHAYRLAEELCASVKKRFKDDGLGDTASGLDWHFAAGGRVSNLDETREREFLVVNQGDSKARRDHLESRPLLIGKGNGGWRNWETFCETVDHLTNDADWSGRRNKLKALRDVLRQGPDHTERYLRSGAMKLPFISGSGDMETRGWQGGYCGYFDAIEAMDDFVQLGER